jgi:hypothetical protein
MKGRRIYPDAKGWLTQALEPGDYGCANPTQMQDGSPVEGWLKNHYPQWLAMTPNGHGGSLFNHQVTEHEDGTITVSPSILITTSNDGGKTQTELWHGYLERGVWRAC